MFPALPPADLALFPGGRAPLSYGCCLVETPAATLLVDSSVGPPRLNAIDPAFTTKAREQRPLLSLLAAAGVAPDAVTAVVHTHLHRDHHSGNVLGGGGLAFPGATHYVQRGEAEYWSSTPELRARSGWDETIRPVEEAGKLRLVDGALEIAAGVTLRPAGGHTPGHQVVVVEDPEAGKAYVVGDLLHQTLQVEHRDWSPRFDWDAEKARESRERVLGEIEREGARMLSPHFPFPGVGRIEAGKWAPGWGPAKPKEAAVEELAADPIAFWGAWSKAHDADACRVGEDGVKCSCFEGLGSVM